MTIARAGTPVFAISSWSLHRLLGRMHRNGPGQTEPFATDDRFGDGRCSLLALPAELARRGFRRAEICHFHIGRLDGGYLAEVKQAFAASGVVIQTLLVDDGDLCNESTRERDMAWIAKWIGVAGQLGALHARIIAGKAAPSAAALTHSVDGLRRLAQRGADLGVRIVTENWFALTATPTEVIHILDRLEGTVGLLADTGNWGGPDKYDKLAAIFQRAELCHAKAEFGAADSLDETDFGQCIAAARRSGYAGPFTLIYDGPGDEWSGLDAERSFIGAQLAASPG